MVPAVLAVAPSVSWPSSSLPVTPSKRFQGASTPYDTASEEARVRVTVAPASPGLLTVMRPTRPCHCCSTCSTSGAICISGAGWFSGGVTLNDLKTSSVYWRGFS
ncbi:hypothetical protein D3C85_1162160 [compost metagenome]